MKKILIISGSLILAFLLYVVYMISNPVSPKETVNFNSDLSEIEVVYSRPYKKDRLIFGDEAAGALVPFGKYWRTGANAATTFETSNEISFNGQKLKAGKYSLYTFPGKEEWKVVLNSENDTFFAISEPDYTQDVLKTIAKSVVDSKNVVEQFTIRFSENSKGADMFLIWDTTTVTITIN